MADSLDKRAAETRATEPEAIRRPLERASLAKPAGRETRDDARVADTPSTVPTATSPMGPHRPPIQAPKPAADLSATEVRKQAIASWDNEGGASGKGR